MPSSSWCLSWHQKTLVKWDHRHGRCTPLCCVQKHFRLHIFWRHVFEIEPKKLDERDVRLLYLWERWYWIWRGTGQGIKGTNGKGLSRKYPSLHDRHVWDSLWQVETILVHDLLRRPHLGLFRLDPWTGNHSSWLYRQIESLVQKLLRTIRYSQHR